MALEYIMHSASTTTAAAFSHGRRPKGHEGRGKGITEKRKRRIRIRDHLILRPNAMRNSSFHLLLVKHTALFLFLSRLSPLSIVLTRLKTISIHPLRLLHPPAPPRHPRHRHPPPSKRPLPPEDCRRTRSSPRPSTSCDPRAP